MSGLPDASSFLTGPTRRGNACLPFKPRLPLAVPFRPRARSVRRPFHPANWGGPYRLPSDVQDRLTAALSPFRNREAAFTLAMFLARFWSRPERGSIETFPSTAGNWPSTAISI